ncbi:MAG: gas vesicle protein [Acidobacteria bacterium]|nr:gas vesicle protein [Acidobacteriota bacterium]
MTLERTGAAARNLVDVLDRILDKGIVVDAWIRVSLAGIEVLTIEARMVVASITTYRDQANAFAVLPA